MGSIIKNATIKNLWFWIFSGIAIVMLIASWAVPPTGEIHASTLKGVAEIFAFAVLGTVIYAIDRGIDAKLTKGDISLELNNPDNNNDNQSETDA